MVSTPTLPVTLATPRVPASAPSTLHPPPPAGRPRSRRPPLIGPMPPTAVPLVGPPDAGAAATEGIGPQRCVRPVHHGEHSHRAGDPRTRRLALIGPMPLTAVPPIDPQIARSESVVQGKTVDRLGTVHHGEHSHPAGDPRDPARARIGPINPPPAPPSRPSSQPPASPDRPDATDRRASRWTTGCRRSRYRRHWAAEVRSSGPSW